MHEIIVVGGGPAGLTAALYAARAGRSVLVVEQSSPGGQILYSPLVENFPGLPGTSGAQFADALTAQVEQLGVEFAFAEVLGFRAGPAGQWVVSTDCGDFVCQALILAPGTRHRTLGLPGEAEFVGAGISYCAVCDGPFYAQKQVAVVGGGDTALQDALFLSDICRSVALIHRRGEFRGEAQLAARVRSRDNIRLYLGYVPESLLLENGAFAGLRLRAVQTGETADLAADGAFIAIGQVPGTAPFAGLVETDEQGYFRAGEDCRTRLPGVFVAGDCRTKTLRQLTTAAGDGAMAGMAAAQYLQSR